MPNIYTAGELATIIKRLGYPDLEDVGADDDQQNQNIFYFMNVVMMKHAKLANQVVFSDAKTLSADGYVTFQRNSSDISDMFEPKYINDPNGKPVQKRTSEDAPKGWWRESEATQIHVRGFSLTSQALSSGSYTLCYIKYPKRVTLTTDTVEFPPSGYDTLIKDVLALMKYTGNNYGQAEYLDAQARRGYNQIVQGSISARGTGSTGQPPSWEDSAKAGGT